MIARLNTIEMEKMRDEQQVAEQGRIELEDKPGWGIKKDRRFFFK